MPIINMADLEKPDGKKNPAPQLYKIYKDDLIGIPLPS
jgi:hypothetical protein